MTIFIFIISFFTAIYSILGMEYHANRGNVFAIKSILYLQGLFRVNSTKRMEQLFAMSNLSLNFKYFPKLYLSDVPLTGNNLTVFNLHAR